MIDRNFLHGFNADAMKALAAVASKHGVTITRKNGSFARDGSYATIKFELASIGSEGESFTKEAQEFKLHAERYGMDPNSLGSIINFNGKKYRLTGLAPSRKKFPISAERVSDGKKFKLPASAVATKTLGTVEGLTPDIKQLFATLACQLSPENLSCDGEASHAEMRRRSTAINLQWRALEARAGRSVSTMEAEGWLW